MRQLLSASASAPVSAALAAAVSAETRGNPFFARELIRHLIEEGAVRPDEEGALISDLPGSPVPEGVRQVLARRRTRLSSAANRLLDTAAAVDGPFRFGVVAEVAGLDDIGGLAALDEIIDERASPPMSSSPATSATTPTRKRPSTNGGRVQQPIRCR